MLKLKTEMQICPTMGDILSCTFHKDLVYDLGLCIKKVAVCSIKCSLDPKPFRFKTPLTQRRSQSLRARIRQFRNNDVCYNPVWEILNGLFTPVWSNASPKPMTVFIVRGLLKATFKVWQYQHAWGQIKMLMRLVHHSRLCQGGGGQHPYVHASHSALSLAVKLIKALCLYWGIAPVQRNFTWQQMNDLTHCQSYTALAKSSIWLNTDIHAEEREQQGYGCRRTRLYFSSSLRCK